MYNIYPYVYYFPSFFLFHQFIFKYVCDVNVIQINKIIIFKLLSTNNNNNRNKHNIENIHIHINYRKRKKEIH